MFHSIPRPTGSAYPRGRDAQGLLAFLIAMVLIGTFAPLVSAAPPAGGTGQRPLWVPPTPVTVNLTVAADASVVHSTLDSALANRNLGGGNRLFLGKDPPNGMTTRSVLRFDVSSIPRTASILGATLTLTQAEGPAGIPMEVHRVQRPWIEGAGDRFLYRHTITITEPVGVARVREPVDIALTLPPGVMSIAPADFRVYDAAGAEVPSQIYGITTDAGGNITSAHVVFASSHGRREIKTYTLYYGTIFRTVPTWRTKTLAPSGGWNSTMGWSYPIGTNFAALAAADLDGDGRTLEVVVGGRDGRVYAFRPNGTLVPGWPSAIYDTSIDTHLTVADLDNDTQPEVIFGTSAGPIYVLRSDGSLWWSTAGNLAGPIVGAFALGDTNLDGRLELYAAGNDRFFYGFNWNGTFLWQSAGLTGGDTSLAVAVANVLGDATPEVVCNTVRGSLHVYRTNWTGWGGGPAAVDLVSSGTTITQFTFVSPSVADTTGTGEPLVIWGNQQVPRGQYFISPGTGPGTAATRYFYATGADQQGGQVVVDWGDDGRLETAFIQTPDPGTVTALNATGSLLWTQDMQNPSNTSSSALAIPAAADVDLDGEEDIIVGGGDGALYVFNSTGAILRRWQLNGPIRTTPIVADLDGDGTMEIVVTTYVGVNPNPWTYTINTSSLGHDFRAGGYNIAHTGRWLDGNTPEGVRLLTVNPSGPIAIPQGVGINWISNGTSPWASQGVDFISTSLAAASSLGPGLPVTWNVTSLVAQWVADVAPASTGLLLNVSSPLSGLLTFYSREAPGNLAPRLMVTYLNDVAPRITTPIPAQVKLEDTAPWNLNLAGYAYDPNNNLSELTWTLTGVNASLVRVLGARVTGNMVLNFSVVPNAFGTNRVTIFLRDLNGNTDNQQVWINITQVNDAPAFVNSPLALLYVHYDKPYTYNYDFYLNDVDDPRASLTLTVDDTSHASVSGHNVTFLYPQSMKDTWQFVVVTVRDPKGATASHVVGIRVTSDNPPTVRTPLPDVTLREGETLLARFDLDEYFTDPDREALFFTSGNIHVNITINPDHTVDFRAPRGWSGVELVNFRAKDPTGAVAEDAIQVTVIHVNNPPTITSLPPLFVVHYNAVYRFNITPYISDLDNTTDQLVVTTSNPVNITVVGKELVMLYGPTRGAQTYPYEDYITVYVDDGINRTFAFTTVRVTDDFPPEVQRSLPDVAFEEDTIFRNGFGGGLQNYFRDVDSTTIFYSSGQVNIQVTIHPNYTVDFTSRKDWTGTELVTFRATDDRYAFAEDSIQVVVTAVDDAPVIDPIPDQVRPGPGSWFLDLTNLTSDIDHNISELLVTSDKPERVRVVGLFLIFDYPDPNTRDTVRIRVSDGLKSTEATVNVIIRGPDILTSLLPWIISGVVAASVYLVAHRLKTVIEEVFLIHSNGLPIAHLSRSLTPEKDPDLVASLFTAIRSFARDSFRGSGAGDIRGLELGSHRVYIAQGKVVFLAVLYKGRVSKSISRRAEEVLKKVEAGFGDALRNWSGMTDELSGIRAFLESFYGAKATKDVRHLAELQATEEGAPEGQPHGVGAKGAPPSEEPAEGSPPPGAPPPPPA